VDLIERSLLRAIRLLLLASYAHKTTRERIKSAWSAREEVSLDSVVLMPGLDGRVAQTIKPKTILNVVYRSLRIRD